MTRPNPTQPRVCLNCGEPLRGPFCHCCGQREQDRNLAVRHIFKDVVHDIWHFDAKVLQTLKFLILRPGFLTTEYLAGRRARHVPPFRLYVFVSFVLFSLLAFEKGQEKYPAAREQEAAVTTVHGKEAASSGGKTAPGEREARAGRVEIELGEGETAKAWERRIEHAAKDPEAFGRHLQHRISQAMFVLLPSFALLLTALYRRRKRYFVEHMVFSLHAHTFFFLVFILQNLLDRLPGSWTGCLGGLLFLVLPVHLGMAMSRVYGQSRPKLLLKGALLSASYLFVVGGVILGVVVLTALEL